MRRSRPGMKRALLIGLAVAVLAGCGDGDHDFVAATPTPSATPLPPTRTATCVRSATTIPDRPCDSECTEGPCVRLGVWGLCVARAEGGCFCALPTLTPTPMRSPCPPWTPTPSLLARGERCERGRQCMSGKCAEGICCEGCERRDEYCGPEGKCLLGPTPYLRQTPTVQRELTQAEAQALLRRQ